MCKRRPNSPEYIGVSKAPYQYPENTVGSGVIFDWTTIAETYMSCHLTYQSDRVVAISALARETALRNGFKENHYHHGYWSEDRKLSGEQLLWEVQECVSTSLISVHDHHIPSWSWLSSQCPIIFRKNQPGKEDHDSLCSMVEIQVVSVGDSYGPAKSGSIQLTGRLAPATLVRDKDFNLKMSQKLTIGNGFASAVFDKSQEHQTEMFCLPIRVRWKYQFDESFVERIKAYNDAEEQSFGGVDTPLGDLNHAQWLREANEFREQNERFVIEGLVMQRITSTPGSASNFRRIGLFTLVNDMENLIYAMRYQIPNVSQCTFMQTKKISERVLELMGAGILWYNIAII